MKHLLESVLSKKTGLYKNTISPYKRSVLEWLKRNKFIECDRHDYVGNGDRRAVLAKEKNDIYFCGPNYAPYTNWISIHTENIYELVFWFDENEEIEEIELRGYPTGMVQLTFDDAVKTLLEA